MVRTKLAHKVCMGKFKSEGGIKSSIFRANFNQSIDMIEVIDLKTLVSQTAKDIHIVYGPTIPLRIGHSVHCI